ncbi:MAG TPA: DNA helicase RecQ [Gammaproteobacteria bacterium]|nr:DNA helicase RecQ [Gammaproteobacteria bacterium]
MDPLARTLDQVFGLHDFRPGQQAIIEALIEGRDAFVLMPTGGGKSLCYQLPALHRSGVALVVSPLISLMKDQVDALAANGVQAAFYNSSLDSAEARRVLARLHGGELDLLYVAPERLMNPAFIERLKGLRIALIAVDEAHCVSQWGHDFRPEYAALGQLRGHFPGVPLIALTATADPQTREDTVRVLGLEQADRFVASFDRPNIRYTVLEKHRPAEQLQRFLAGRQEESGIVYALSRKRTEEIAQLLADGGYSAAAYHAGLPAAVREDVQERFVRDDVRIVVATVAFGMGIDKPDVRFIVHYDLPKHIEGYYQETGRAGRDGLPAEALLLYGAQDVVTARRLLESTTDPEQRRIEGHKLQAMVAFAESLTCRRQVLLGYFGEHLGTACGNCDVCLDPPECFDATVETQKALSCVYRVGQRFGIRYVVDVLRGADSEQIRQRGHDLLSTFGIGCEHGEQEWISIVRQLIHRGYLEQDIAAWSVLKLTQRAGALLRGEETLELARPRIREKAKKKKLPRSAAPLEPAELEVFESLRALRKRLADEQGVPPYVVFGDASLVEMSRNKPATAAEFLEITGVGQVKLERYGQIFMRALACG